MKREDKAKIKEYIKEGTIFWGELTKVDRMDIAGSMIDYMELVLPKSVGISEAMKVTIMDMEADISMEHASLVNLFGRQLPFCLIELDKDGAIYGSRKAAQEKILSEMAEGFEAGTVYAGTVTAVKGYGVHVEVRGLSGLLHNSDCTTDRSEAREYFKMGDTVMVRCKHVSEFGRIDWECVEKMTRTKPVELDFDEGSVIPGTITSIKAFDGNSGVGVFVNLLPGIDTLCPMPQDLEVEEHQHVAIRVIKIDRDPENPLATPRIRGKIIRAL